MNVSKNVYTSFANVCLLKIFKIDFLRNERKPFETSTNTHTHKSEKTINILDKIKKYLSIERADKLKIF